MSIFIGFREHYNYFPDVIYYSATDQEIEELKAKYPADFSTSDDMSTGSSKADKTPTTEIPIQELKDELKQAREQILMMKEEIRQQEQAMLQEQMIERRDPFEKQKSSVLQEERIMIEERIEVLQEQNSMLQQQVTGLQGQNTVLLEQNTAIQGQMKEIQALLSTLLASKTGAGFS
ncbi:hypothetical protein BGZ50_001284 [Haplosporangium sp. Z 11]|nr:hypothetical protein BGZ50_001284 [Haplosporangium sp. Z 11]